MPASHAMPAQERLSVAGAPGYEAHLLEESAGCRWGGQQVHVSPRSHIHVGESRRSRYRV